MTKDEAIATAAQWWSLMIVSLVWENGDPESERTHALFRAAMPTPQMTDTAALEHALRTYFATLAWQPESRIMDCYCDYAASWLDTVLHTVNPRWESRFCGPQKAGTRFHIDAAGDVTVLAKRGYGQPWQPLGVAEHAPTPARPIS